jgi:Fe-S-cluster containining protein
VGVGYKEDMSTLRPTNGHPPVSIDDDERAASELTAAENADLCAGCVKCCTYITVEVDTPRAAWEYDQWIWALEHRGVSLYLERPEKWLVHFETVCENLTEAGRCAIHGRHPVLCREYDPRTCERRLPLDIVAEFHNGRELEAWMIERRPGHHRRLLAYRAAQPAGPPVADAEADRRSTLVTIAEPRTRTVTTPTRRTRNGAAPASNRSNRRA